MNGFPQWKSHLRTLLGPLKQKNLESCFASLTRMALIHGLFGFQGTNMLYQGSVEQFLAIYARKMKRDDITPVKPSTLLIPAGEYQDVQRSIIDRRRNKRTFVVIQQ